MRPQLHGFAVGDGCLGTESGVCGGDKPWWLHFTRCPEYFTFLREAGGKKSTRCATWLHHRLERAKSLPANWTCGGIKQCVF